MEAMTKVRGSSGRCSRRISKRKLRPTCVAATFHHLVLVEVVGVGVGVGVETKTKARGSSCRCSSRSSKRKL